MKLLRPRRNFGISGRSFFYCAVILLLAGLVGTGIQNKLLGVDFMTNSELFERMQEDSRTTNLVTICVICQVLEACAIPIFAFLMVQLADSDADYKRWMAYVLGAAILVQIPYALLGGAGFNSVFSLVMAMVMLYFFRRFRERKLGHILIKAIAVVGTFLWGNILGISCCASCIVITAVLWPLRKKKTIQVFVGLIVTMACMVFSLFNLVAAISFALLHVYDGNLGLPQKD